MPYVTSPEEFFGYRMGSDGEIARWDKIVEYFQSLDAESDRINVIDMGDTTEGNRFLLAVISAPDNLADLEHLRRVNAQISDPRGLTEETARELVREGRTFVCQTMSMHATEIGGTQMSPELAHDLLSGESEEIERILENVVFLMVPSFNPDGQIMVTDWYREYLGTTYEGCRLPWLYHKYAGHDNNRDAFMLNIPESQFVAQILFRQFRPQAYMDHHHMGSYGARFYVAPYCDPIHPHADPLIWREHSWFGAHMAYRLEEAGKKGILNAAQFPGWGHLGFHWITAYHNIAGMLTESASAKLATPLYIEPSQLRGASPKTMPRYEPQTNFPNPWEGGWWRLRDIVEQKKISSLALLDICARHRETVLYNAYQKAKRQTERGRTGRPRAFIVQPDQHDPLTANKLVCLLLDQGIEVVKSRDEFSAEGRIYPAGTHVVFCSQPKMGLIKTLLNRTLHPDTYWTRNPDGTPVVFDTASDTVAEYMGVRVTPVGEAFTGDFEVMGSAPSPVGEVSGADAGHVFDARLNDAYAAVNRLVAEGCEVYRLLEDLDVNDHFMPRGCFYVADAPVEVLEDLASTGVSFWGLPSPPEIPMKRVGTRRVGIYQRYWGGNADEGWTRFIMDTFGFSYEILRDSDIRSDDLSERVDVIILPNDPLHMIVDIESAEASSSRRARMLRWMGDSLPPEYRSGIGGEGVEALGRFVRSGGRLVAFDAAWKVAAQACDLKVTNVVEGLGPKEFFTHGSTLRCFIDSVHPLGCGMPDEALVFSWDSAAFDVHEMVNAERYEVVARYPQQDLLMSGRLIGEDKIAGKPAMLSVACGDGEAVLIGFRCQHRAQTHGTYKLLFNCLI